MNLVERPLKLKRGRAVIVPIGDIQWNGSESEVALARLRRFLAYTQELRRLAAVYYIGMGDYIDFMSPSNRLRLRGAQLYDTAATEIEHAARALVREILDRSGLADTWGQWLAVLHGHHFTEFADGTNSDMFYAAQLDAPYHGTSVHLRLHLPHGDVGLIAMHGTGGSSQVGSVVNRVVRFSESWDDVDLVLMGHTNHLYAALGPSRMRAVEGRLRERPVRVVGTGGWSKGYVEGLHRGCQPRGTYVEERMLSPTHIGAPLIWLVQEADGFIRIAVEV